MRYLRMLSNSLVAGALATAYVVVLVLQLNPSLPLSAVRLMALVTTIGLFYAVHLTVIFYIVLVVRQILATEVFSPAWVSVGVLVWLGAAASAAGAALIWGNLQTFTLVLEPAMTEEMATSALALLVASALFVCVALVRAQFGRRARASCAVLIVAIAAASVAVPLTLRGRGAPRLLEARPIDMAATVSAAERSARVTIVAIDGGSLQFVTSATTEGRLPNFGRILDAGAVMHLATLHPTSAEAVWTAVATGKWPQKNGVRAASLDARFETPGRTDRGYDRIAQALARSRPAQVAVVRYQSLDAIGHYFLRYAMPAQFGDVTDEERRRFGSVLEWHYSMIDEGIGRAIAALGPDDLLLVVSGYGMEPLGLGKRLLERLIGDPDVSGTHETAPDGF